MALEPAITDLEQLSSNELVAAVLGWKKEAVKGAKLDRGELTLEIDRAYIYEMCEFLQTKQGFNFLSDLTVTDWYPTEPRFQVVYHLLSHSTKRRVRLNARISGDEAAVESITGIYPAANFFEREAFDLFGIRFTGHPNLSRIMMPDTWEGHPLRKDYPVEGYR